jgi:putative tryptophan/tyrosine transport system substrate-binding protein
MQRRDVFKVMAAAAVAWPLASQAQQGTKVPRIGVLFTGALDSPEQQTIFGAFRLGLGELGYIDGKNIVIEARGAGGMIDRLPELASELVRLKVDVIVANATPAGRAAQQATDTIPVIVSAMGDPVEDGFATSLSRPGGNITGTTFLGPELLPKRLALLKELLPTMEQVAALTHPGAFSDRTMKDMNEEIATAAKALGVRLHFVEATKPEELESAFSVAASSRVDALFEFPSPMFFSQRKRIVELAALHRLPAMYNAREFVQLGGLIAYGTNLIDLQHQAAIYVDKILKGARPSDLPIERPTKFELFINRSTAKALGLAVPQALLVTADEVLD